jgi:predicted ATP-dependent serine protease
MESSADVNEILKKLDMKSKAELLLAAREDLEKCKTKNSSISDHSLNTIYSNLAQSEGFVPVHSYDVLISEMNKIKHFRTGMEELDQILKSDGLASDELVEIVGASASGKTQLCLKVVSLALLE